MNNTNKICTINYVETVADLLGVGIGEKFTLKGAFYIAPNKKPLYMFSMSGLYEMGDDGDFKIVEDNTLDKILTGNLLICRLPFVPRLGDNFFFVEEDGLIASTTKCSSAWQNVMIKIGNCFRTEKEITKTDIMKFKAFYNHDRKIDIDKLLDEWALCNNKEDYYEDIPLAPLSAATSFPESDICVPIAKGIEAKSCGPHPNFEF